MNEPIPFWGWKEQQIEKDSEIHNCDRFLRLREWYWDHYGRYCNKVRKENPTK